MVAAPKLSGFPATKFADASIETADYACPRVTSPTPTRETHSAMPSARAVASSVQAGGGGSGLLRLAATSHGCPLHQALKRPGLRTPGPLDWFARAWCAPRHRSTQRPATRTATCRDRHQRHGRHRDPERNLLTSNTARTSTNHSRCTHRISGGIRASVDRSRRAIARWCPPRRYPIRRSDANTTCAPSRVPPSPSVGPCTMR